MTIKNSCRQNIHENDSLGSLKKNFSLQTHLFSLLYHVSNDTSSLCVYLSNGFLVLQTMLPPYFITKQYQRWHN